MTNPHAGKSPEQNLLEAAWDDNERLRILNARLAVENESLRAELAALREGGEVTYKHPETLMQ